MAIFEKIKKEIMNDPMNHSYTIRGIEPLFKASKNARIAIVGQAPGRKAEETGLYWNDLSGDRLREWFGVSREEFYNNDRIAQLPMDFYFPGKAKTGDLPPRKGFAEKWHPLLLEEMPNIETIILVGNYAQRHYLNKGCEKNLTETVRNFLKYLPEFFPLVHPSPLNIVWLKRNPRRYLQGYLFVFVAGTLWGIGGFFVTKMSDMGASSLMTVFTGHFLALPPLLLYILAKKGTAGLKISKKGLLYSILLGVLTKGIFKLSLDTSMTLVGVATSTILMYLAPVWTAIMAMIFFKEKLRGYQKFALVLNLIGCVLMVTGGNFTKLNISGLGLALGLAAGFLYGLSTILGKVGTSEDDSMTMAFYMFLFSSITTAIFAKPWEHIGLFSKGKFLLWALAGAGLSGTLANVLFFKGLSMGIDASKATIVASIEVVVATVAGVFLLNEQINLVGYIGIVIMLASIVLMNINVPISKESTVKQRISVKEIEEY